MCLITDNPEILTAEKDIICYKNVSFIGNKKAESWHWNYVYTKNELSPKIALIIQTSPMALLADLNRSEVEFGYHSREKLFTKFGNNSIFLIPKDTKYIKGLECGQAISNYVSETIIYKGRLNIFNWIKIKLQCLKRKDI